MASKQNRSQEFKRAIDLGQVELASPTDLTKIWRIATGDEKAISLFGLVASVDRDILSVPDGNLADLEERIEAIEDGNVLAYTDLTDTDSTYIGQNGKVPIVDELNNRLIFGTLPTSGLIRLISGGIVQWSGIGFVFNVSRAIAEFNGFYVDTLVGDIITLDPADTVNDRIDVIFVDIDGNFGKITGTPAVSPVKPQVEPLTQIELTSIIVQANATTPIGTTTETVYDENTEWTVSFVGTGTGVSNSTNNPYEGTVSIETTNITQNYLIRFDNGFNYDLTGATTLGMFLNLKGVVFAAQEFTAQWLDASNNPLGNEVILSFDKNLVGTYQFIAVGISAFGLTSPLVRKLQIAFRRTRGGTTQAGFFLDVVKIQGGVTVPPIVVGMPPVAASYASQAQMIADQPNQLANYIYFDGTKYWEYLGTLNGTIVDYRAIGAGTISGLPNYLAKFNSSGNDIDESLFYQSGNFMGLGITSPITLLHGFSNSIPATILADSTSATNFSNVLVRGNNGGISFVSWGTDYLLSNPAAVTVRGKSGIYINNLGVGDKSFNIWNGFTQYMSITEAGLTSIGSTVPTEKLDIDGRLRIRTIATAIGEILTVGATGVVTKNTAEGLGLVLIATDQTITGQKKFTQPILVDNAEISNQQNLDVDSATPEIVAEVNATLYTAAFFDYSIKKGLNLRAGTVYSTHDGTNVVFTETMTQDLGNTAGVELSVELNAGSLQLIATVDSNDWIIKTLVRAI